MKAQIDSRPRATRSARSNRVANAIKRTAAGGLGYQARDNLALEAYYRAYSVDYEDDRFLYDTTLHGVFAGLAFYF